jgi:hypothetical protein
MFRIRCFFFWPWSGPWVFYEALLDGKGKGADWFEFGGYLLTYL